MLQIRTKSHQSNSFNIYIAHYLQGLWKKLFCASSSDHGTLNQMYSLLGRLPAAKNPKSDMNACVDALMTVLNGHYIAMACSVLKIEKPDDPLTNVPDPKNTTLQEKQLFVFNVADKVLDQCGLVDDALLFKVVPDSRDGVNNYTRVLCHHASLALEFRDAWAEGDGERITRC